MRQPSFNEIMDYSAENRIIYKDLLELMKKSKDSGDYMVVPFVGAGMSAFAYPMWKGALTELAKELGETPKSIKNLFDTNSNLEDVADMLWNIAKRKKYRTETGRIIKGTPIIGEILRNKIFKKEAILNEKLKQQAIYELAWMFPNSLIITTNFDKALENAFSLNGKEIPCGFPGPNQEMLSQLASKNDQSYLFKMHGDIYGNTDNFVFPTTSYDREYKDGSKLRGFLADIFSEKSMFFLGASLNQDRYLALLKESRDSDFTNQHSHFAILESDSEPGKANKRRAELAVYGIKAIFYPKGQYDAVHVILEQLFEDVNPIGFEIFEPKFKNKLNLSKRFDFRNPFTEFVGRAKELERLNDFLNGKNWNSTNTVFWWAVCGPGGMGKSRIAREFSRNMLPGWKVCSFFDNRRLSFNDIQNKVDKCGSKVLIIVDYAQNISSDFANWLQSVDNSGSGKEYRLLFLQREGYQYASYESDGERQTSQAEIKPYWLKNLENSWNEVKNLRYQDNSLDLKPLNSEAIKEIILSYANFLPETEPEEKKPITEKDAEALLEALKKLGDDFLRPLFAMFFADAYLSGNDPLGWDEQRILEHFSNREVMRLREGLKTLYERKRRDPFSEDYEALDLIIALATIQGDLQINPKKPQIEFFGCFKNELYPPNSEFVSLYKGLTDVGLLEFDVSKKQYIFRAIRPDLLGEWTIFKYFANSANNEEAQSKLMNVLKQSRDLNAVEDFFVRFGGHYLSGHSLEKIGEAWLMELKEFPPARIGLIIGLGTYAFNKRDFSVFKTVELLSKGFDDFETVVNYSIYLAIQLTDQGAIGKESEKQLLELIKSSDFTEDIALAYAQGLVNLTFEQESAKERGETVQKIKALKECFPKSEEIALEYTIGLVKLTAVQESADDINLAVQEIKSLLEERFPDSEEITLRYTKGLVNLTSVQKSPEDINVAVQEIKSLLEKSFPDSEEIALCYARGLFNLTVVQESAEDINLTVQMIKALEERFLDSEEIAHVYARGLVNLTAVQESTTEIKETTQKIEVLSEEHFPKSEEITLRYAQALANLSAVQENTKGREETVQKIETLLEDRYPKSEEIAIEYARGLANLTYCQENTKEIKETVQKIETLLEKERFSKSEGIVFEYAKGLFNLTLRQESVKEIKESVQKIEALVQEGLFTKPEELILLYARVLAYLTVRQESVKEIKESVQKIEALLEEERFPKSEEIALDYAISLINLMEKIDEPEELQKLHLRITNIVKTPVETELEAEILGNVYLNLLRVENDLAERRKLIDKFHELTLRFPDSEELNKLSKEFPME